MYPNTLTSTKVRKNSKTSEYSTRYVCEGRDVDESSVFEESHAPNVYRYVYREEDFYYPKLSKLDIKHLTSALGIKKEELDSKMALIVAKRKDNAYTRIYNVGSYLNRARFYKYGGRSILFAELEDPFKKKRYSRNYKDISEGEFLVGQRELKKGYIESKEHVSLSATDTSQGNIKSTSVCVVDIDFHNTYGYLTVDDARIFAEYLDFGLSLAGVPANAYVYTGTGLHVYYYYNRVLWQNYERDKKVISLLQDAYDRVYKIIGELAISVTDITKDMIEPFKKSKNPKVSTDRISLRRPMVRAVGSIHEKSQNVCTCIKFNDNLRRWNLGDLISAAKDYLGEEPTGKEWVDYDKKHKKDSQVFRDNISALNENRATDIITILSERGEGHRNRAYCSLVVLMLNQGLSLDKIKSKLLEIDTQNSVDYFKNDRKAGSLVMSMNNWYNRHPKNNLGQVALTNESYLGFMNLDFDSVSDLNLITLGNIPRSVIRAEKAAVRKTRMGNFFNRYTEMWVKGELNISELAREFDVCRNTIYNWIKKLSKKIAEFKRNHLKALAEKAMEPVCKISKFFENYLVKTGRESLANDLLSLSLVT